MAELVAGGLSGPAAVSIHFAFDFCRFAAIAFDKEIDRLSAAPALGVEAGVDHHAAGPERETLEIAEPANDKFVICPQFVGQLFAVKSPAFAEGVEGQHRADQRQAVGVFAFPHMARDGFVIGQVGEIVFAMEIGSPEVDPETARDRAILAARPAIGAGCPDLFRRRDAAYFHLGIDKRVEGARHLAANPVQPLCDEVHDLLAARITFGKFVPRILRQCLHPVANRAGGIADLAKDRIHAGMQFFKLFETLLVDLFGCKSGRRAGS